MPRQLKVFRTSTGFHDAYVAAPSQKAALEAWGADANLFARGVAEQVTDPALTAEPLKRPGEVIRVSRGDLAAQLKALGGKKSPSKKKTAAEPEPEDEPKPAKPKKRTPAPSRARLDKAEAALEQAEEKHTRERQALEREREAIERKIAELQERSEQEKERLHAARDKAAESYREALDKWSG
jgi:hypothetical protein